MAKPKQFSFVVNFMGHVCKIAVNKSKIITKREIKSTAHMPRPRHYTLQFRFDEFA